MTHFHGDRHGVEQGPSFMETCTESKKDQVRFHDVFFHRHPPPPPSSPPPPPHTLAVEENHKILIDSQTALIFFNPGGITSDVHCHCPETFLRCVVVSEFVFPITRHGVPNIYNTSASTVIDIWDSIIAVHENVMKSSPYKQSFVDAIQTQNYLASTTTKNNKTNQQKQQNNKIHALVYGV